MKVSSGKIILLGVSYAVATTSMVAMAQQAPLPESDKGVGHGSVADALKALSSDPGVQWSKENGWPVAIDDKKLSIWSFAPLSYPAYPAVVLRRVTRTGGGSAIEMSILCEASKVACDDLVRAFSSMNGLPLPK